MFILAAKCTIFMQFETETVSLKTACGVQGPDVRLSDSHEHLFIVMPGHAVMLGHADTGQEHCNRLPMNLC